MRHEIELWAPWMSEDTTEELLIEINLTPVWQRKPTKGTLGERLQLTYAERARLDLRTIGPCDMSEGAMALIRNQNRRKRERLRRQKRAARSQAKLGLPPVLIPAAHGNVRGNPLSQLRAP